jgi:hypothetical protein
MDDKTKTFIENRAKTHNARWGHIETKFCNVDALIEIYKRNEYYCKLFPQKNENAKHKVFKKRVQDYMRVLRWGFLRDVMDTLVWEDLELLPKGHRMHSPFKISIYTELEEAEEILDLEPTTENQLLIKELIEKMQS